MPDAERVFIMLRIVCLLIGYVFGNILTAQIVTWRLFHLKAEDVGSGNPGMANIASGLGLGYGLLVLAGDVGKTLAACLICRFLIWPQGGTLAVFYAGLGACLGHDLPVWDHFKGGKGVAVTCSFIVFALPIWGLAADIIGFAVVFFTGSLAVGAASIPAVFSIAAFLKAGAEAGVIMLLVSTLMFARHFPALWDFKAGKGKRVSWSLPRLKPRKGSK